VQPSSKRERYMMVAAALVIGALVLDMFVISPLLAWRQDLSQRHALMTTKLEEAHLLLANNQRMQQRWRQMVDAGLSDSATNAEAMVYRSLGEWARESGLQLQSIIPERMQEDEHLQRVVLRATATGQMRAVARFLEKVEQAEFPLRVTHLQISARREGMDDLTVQVQISTLVRKSDHAAPARTGTAPREAAAGRPGQERRS